MNSTKLLIKVLDDMKTPGCDNRIAPIQCQLYRVVCWEYEPPKNCKDCPHYEKGGKNEKLH